MALGAGTINDYCDMPYYEYSLTDSVIAKLQKEKD